MQLSKNFSLEELTKSNTATRLKITNAPDEKALKNLTELCNKVLQPIREKYGKALIVSSGYRCPKLNTAVKGSKTSQHCDGSAADIHAISDTVSDNKELFNLIKGMVENGELVVGQLIDEYGYDWVHVSLPNRGKKNQILHLK